MLHQKGEQPDLLARICVNILMKRPDNSYPNPELLPEFPNQSLLVRLSLLNLTARKFPVPAEVLTHGTFSDKNFPTFQEDAGCDCDHIPLNDVQLPKRQNYHKWAINFIFSSS